MRIAAVQMQAGREMDALAARAVQVDGVRWEMPWGEDAERPYWRHNGGHREEFRPSTDMTAAMEILEKWKDNRGGHGQFSIYFGSDDWRVTVWENHETYEAYAPTLPLAICRAAIMLAAATSP